MVNALIHKVNDITVVAVGLYANRWRSAPKASVSEADSRLLSRDTTFCLGRFCVFVIGRFVEAMLMLGRDGGWMTGVLLF